MDTTTILTILWIITVGVFVALMVYRARLTNHETDELFLSDSDDDSYRKHEHDDIVRKVNRLTPYCQGAGGAAAIATVALVGVEVAHIVVLMR